MAHLELTVLGDGVVQRGDERHHLLELDAAVPEALVVVDEVEVSDTGLQRLHRAKRECERFAEGAHRELGDLDEVGDGLELPVGGEAARVEIVEQVEAAQLVE